MSLAEALFAFASEPEILVALDFDGTLAEHVDHAEDARALPENSEALYRLLAAPATTVAIVSGRPLEFLQRTAQLPEGLLLVGSHGAEMSSGLELSEQEAATVAAIIAQLGELASGIEGAWVEPKPAGAALHTRMSPAELAPGAQRAARRVAAAIGGLHERDGKNIVEFSVRDDTKGHAVDRLREQLRPNAVLYAGDDVTDEDAFARLYSFDLGIKIGPGPTAAGHRLDHPAEIAGVLTELARLRVHVP